MTDMISSRFLRSVVTVQISAMRRRYVRPRQVACGVCAIISRVSKDEGRSPDITNFGRRNPRPSRRRLWRLLRMRIAWAAWTSVGPRMRARASSAWRESMRKPGTSGLRCGGGTARGPLFPASMRVCRMRAHFRLFLRSG